MTRFFLGMASGAVATALVIVIGGATPVDAALAVAGVALASAVGGKVGRR